MARLARRNALVVAGGAFVAPLLAGCERDNAANKIYTVGSTATGVPYTFVDASTGKPTGALIDVVQAVAKDAGLKIRIEVSAFSELIPSLSAHKIDLVSAAMLRT